MEDTAPLTLALDADKATAAAFHALLLEATRAFLNRAPSEKTNYLLKLVANRHWNTFEMDVFPFYLESQRDFPNNPEAEALVAAWTAGHDWWERDHAQMLATNPREALKDTISRLSHLILHTWWSDNTEYATWQVAILNRPVAVHQGLLATANGVWFNGDPKDAESIALLAEVRRLHELTGGWWWWPDVLSEGPEFVTTAQWEQIYARGLNDPDRGCEVISIKEGVKTVYRGTEGIGQWLDDNPMIAEAFGKGRAE